MKRVQLDLEHHYKNRFIGRHSLQPMKGSWIMGSSNEAHLRLMGEEVAGVQACLEYTDGEWRLSDLGSEKGTWINKDPVLTEVIKKETCVRIGGHELKLVPRVIESDLFGVKRTSDSGSGERYHQVIMRHKGVVIRSVLLPVKASFDFRHAGKLHTLNAPQGSDWTSTQIEHITIQQRVVHASKMQSSIKDNFKDMDQRQAIVSVAGIAMLLALLVWWAPMGHDAKLDQVKADENKFSKIIYDAKTIRKKREQSNQVRKSMESAPTDAPKDKAAPPMNPTISKVVNNLRASGLSSMISKISKRASKNAVFIVSQGMAPDEAPTGPALAGMEGLKKKTGASEAYKISGVSTNGKGGGATTYKGAGGLGTGNVGSGNVGILEEEAEVIGGLDRDEIARVIDSNLGQIRYCYERQLSASPDLYGKILVKFTIGPTGTVVTQAVGSSSLKNAMVEGCILRRIAGWKFPTPKGGTSVLVSYPFLFKSTN